MTEETTTDPETDETPPEPQDDTAPEPKGKETKSAEGKDDKDELTDAERERFKPGMLVAEIRKTVEDILDRRMEALREQQAEAEDVDDDADEETDELRTIRSEQQRLSGEWHAEDAVVEKLAETIKSDKYKLAKLEGKIEDASDPDVVSKLRHDHDRVARELDRAEDDLKARRANQAKITREYRENQIKEQQAKQSSAAARQKAREERQQQLENWKKWRHEFNVAIDSSAKDAKVPEELQDRFFEFVQGAATVDLKSRKDKSGTDIVALAKEHSKRLVAFFEAWKKAEGKSAPRDGDLRRTPPRPTPKTSMPGPPRLQSRAEAQAELDAAMARVRERHAVR